MSRSTQGLRRAFQRPIPVLVKMTPEGFVLEEELQSELTGRLTKARLVRKLFDEGVLVCSSPDGLRARNGTLCEDCGHPRCRPQLRIHLAQGRLVYVLDLAVTSAQNLFAMEDQAAAHGERLGDWRLRLTVRNRGHWGEVCFERT